MKFITHSLTCYLATLSILLLCSCVHNDTQTEAPEPTTEDLIDKVIDETPPKPVQLPVRYQNPGYVTANDQVDEGLDEDQEYEIKVGANIRSTRGPQPLWDIMKRLAKLKGMSVSWASDVNKDDLVDVDINANDNYYDAIDNLLRQVDYFHKVNGSTIIVKYKETKQYHVPMPFTTQLFQTATGGDVLGGSVGSYNTQEGSSSKSKERPSSDVQGSITLDSKQNEFDIWGNIKLNLDSILEIWSGRREMELVAGIKDEEASKAARTYKAEAEQEGGGVDRNEEYKDMKAATKRIAHGYYTIDKPVGIVSVTAPRMIIEKVDAYFETLKTELFKQVSIEAKIIEVQLDDSSSLGINWHTLLDNLSFTGDMIGDKYYTKDTADYNDNERLASRSLTDSFGSNVTNTDGDSTNNSIRSVTNEGSSLASAYTSAATLMTGGAANAAGGLLSLAQFNFNDFIKALSQQGTTSILANPKLSVMNGQPALITVGKNVTYIDSIGAVQNGSGIDSTITYNVETARILSGVGLAITPVIKDDNEIIMNLVPVTSELESPIEYRSVGEFGEVGLPIVNVREMSSMVQIKDGEMLVIGGLISTVESTVGENLFPGLADVPVLKYLTGYEEKVLRKRELIILLRPRIL